MISLQFLTNVTRWSHSAVQFCENHWAAIGLRWCEIPTFFASTVTDYLDKPFSVVHWYWGLNQILRILVRWFFSLLEFDSVPQCQCTTETSSSEWSVTIGARIAAISLALTAATSAFHTALRVVHLSLASSFNYRWFDWAVDWTFLCSINASLLFRVL